MPNVTYDRRDFLSWTKHGLGSAALATLLLRDGVLHASHIAREAGDPPTHRPPKAKRVIHIVACGGVSQIDSFDYKPALEKYHGKELGGDERGDVIYKYRRSQVEMIKRRGLLKELEQDEEF